MKKAYIKYFAALLLFGSNGIIASQINMSSYEIVLLRTFIGSLMLIAVYLISGNRFTFTKKRKSFLFLVASGVAMGACWMFLYEAYQRVGVSISSLLYYCAPVLVMIFSPLLFREKLTPTKIVGFLVVVAGVFLVNGKASGELDRWGLLCGGMSAVMYFLLVVCNKKATEIDGLENATLQLTISFFTVAIFVLYKQGIAIHIPADDVIWIILLGLVNTGAGCWFYFSSISDLPVQTVAICGYLEPLAAVILSVVLLHETMTAMQIIGVVMIIAGAAWGECFGNKRT